MTFKLIFIQLILSFICLNYSFAQTNQPINIPVLKESPQVDLVLDKFIAKRPAILKGMGRLGGEYEDDVEVLLRDSCLQIAATQRDSVKEDNIYVQSRRKTSINEEINIDVHLKFKFGCFTYKGFKVFVWTRNNFGRLFSETDRMQTFDFIYLAGKNQTYPRGWVGDGIDYQIKDNTLTERIPTIISKKQNR